MPSGDSDLELAVTPIWNSRLTCLWGTTSPRSTTQTDMPRSRLALVWSWKSGKPGGGRSRIKPGPVLVNPKLAVGTLKPSLTTRNWRWRL